MGIREEGLKDSEREGKIEEQLGRGENETWDERDRLGIGWGNLGIRLDRLGGVWGLIEQ